MKVGFVSLGCSKNLVDTERVIGLFKNKGFSIINQPEEAEIIVVNTCGFIESAKEEAINTILEMAEYKNQNCRYLVVMGCLVQRYQKELIKALPEVDLFIKYEDYDSFWLQIQKLLFPETNTENGLKKEPSYLDRIITTGENYAYIKIADGCNNCCTFCAIPGIRGKFCSRSIDEIIEDVNLLAKKGIKEIILIAQDTTKYGLDLYGRSKLTQLLEEISKIEGIVWIRFLYAYPESITDELIQVVKNNPKVCPYFDIPIQHISDHVLKRMNRKSTGKTIRDLIIYM